jgi:opacity protein-like surface antigen
MPPTLVRRLLLGASIALTLAASAQAASVTELDTQAQAGDATATYALARHYSGASA